MPPLRVADRERAIRTVEAFNALAVVLPIYDEEARKVFRASFGVDMAELIPRFFKALALESLRRPAGFAQYVSYFAALMEYVDGRRDSLPLPDDPQAADYFKEARADAVKLLNAWGARDVD